MGDTDDIFLPGIKLGFGMMRLPRRGLRIDVEKVGRMVDRFMEAGGTYVDTAFIYPGSEEATRRALVERHPRSSFQLATKLFATGVPTRGIARGEFEKSLRRTGVDYVDFYLLHAVMEGNWRTYERFGLWDYVADLKRRGLVRHWGFSYHAGPELLDRILTAHPEAEFVQLQINYLDWDDPKVAARANYEVARRHGKPVIVMEPVKGGILARPAAKVRAVLDACRPGASPASWAMRFAASLPGVARVLSGMSDEEQVADNVATMADFRPLDAQERAALAEARRLMGAASDATGEVRCTACRYCCDGCPQGIAIPDVIAALNALRGGQGEQVARDLYARAVADGAPASACVRCGRCEARCPQRIGVIKALAAAAESFEGATA